MRVAPWLLAALVLVAQPAAADTIVWTEFLNSNLTFGTVNPTHVGRDLSTMHVERNGLSEHVDTNFNSTFTALTATFVDLSFAPLAGRPSLEWRYLYEGGTFRMDLRLNTPEGEISGSFIAPILELEIFASDPCVCPTNHEMGVVVGSAWAWYDLGPGVFDEAIANVMGVSRYTTGGLVESSMSLFASDAPGDHTTPVRHARDGATWVTLQVPEPSLAVLAVLAAAGLIRHRLNGTRKRLGRI